MDCARYCSTRPDAKKNRRRSLPAALHLPGHVGGDGRQASATELELQQMVEDAVNQLGGTCGGALEVSGGKFAPITVEELVFGEGKR